MAIPQMTNHNLDKYTEAVASAERDVYVGQALVREHESKLTLAREELDASRKHMYRAKQDLERAAVALHEAVHGKPVSFDDRYEFEKRWDAKVAANEAKKAEAEAKYQAEVKVQDHVHEDCCK